MRSVPTNRLLSPILLADRHLGRPDDRAPAVPIPLFVPVPGSVGVYDGRPGAPSPEYSCPVCVPTGCRGNNVVAMLTIDLTLCESPCGLGCGRRRSASPKIGSDVDFDLLQFGVKLSDRRLDLYDLVSIRLDQFANDVIAAP